MFCHGCLYRYVRVFLIGVLILQAAVRTYLSGNVRDAFVHAHNFTLVWRALSERIGQ